MKKFLTIFAMFMTGTALGQVPVENYPKPVPQVPAATDRQGDRTMKRQDIAEGRRHTLWKDTAVDQDGYLRVVGVAKYLELPEDFTKHPTFKNQSNLNGLPAKIHPELQLIGNLAEGPRRVTWVFKHNARLVALTVWNYQADGAVVTQYEEFNNQIVDSVPAVLTLVTAEKSSKSLWKMAWEKQGVSYEMYVPDSSDRFGKPKLFPADIKRISSLVLSSVK